MGNEGETVGMVTKYKVLDFLEELPRRMLAEVEIDETVFKKLVKGDKETWNSVISALADVDACGLYPPTAPSCQRWLRTLATAVAALAKVNPEKLDDKLLEELQEFIVHLGLFLITGDTRSFVAGEG
jgi:lysophospholipase L1-like esterase